MRVVIAAEQVAQHDRVRVLSSASGKDQGNGLLPCQVAQPGQSSLPVLCSRRRYEAAPKRGEFLRGRAQTRYAVRGWGATSLSQKSMYARSLASPRGQRRSTTNMCVPSLGSDAS